jgi:AraC-like DNA-binding protein
LIALATNRHNACTPLLAMSSSDEGEIGIVGAVRREIRHGLVVDGGDVRPPTLARRLAMSTRTLQRRLAEYDTSVSKLADEMRREVALELLAERETRVAEIGRRIGFGDPKTVFRAFRRWTGTSPRRACDDLIAPGDPG